MAEGLRRRKVASSDEPSVGAAALESLRHFDVYTKVHEDYVMRSKTGGAVTVVTAFIISLLFWTEIGEFLSVEVNDSISVDTRINQKLHIGLDITFPHLRCDEVSVDTVDSSGDNQVDVHGSLDKLPLDAEGRQVAGDEPTKKGDCLPCLEAADDEHTCCNSCQELKDAYVAKGLAYYHVLDFAEQCKHSIGCRVKGQVIVNKVSGNVHVALGHSTIRDGKHVHEFNMHDLTDGFNTSHEIHSISFGDLVPGSFSPLDGIAKTVKHGSYMFHYYIKLVPTVFTSRWGEELYTHQYAVTDSARNVQAKGGELQGLPGVFFVYDFSPFLMRKTEKTKPWSYLLTSICAIIGGVFSIASLVEMSVSGAMCGLAAARGGRSNHGDTL
mmetsp:Transcript_32999/g.77113  ORF Transcript_32999/g.77113 Transcript_32999/m.77113 type:complete len:383 (+) Transcript_32999:113-1261(+)|eukprot:CAMPEP_0178380416 /NCGR_PEP_ID=MMETSP0689_2-20121128/5451_1 /TAXON_ID=160604 /ORGANISM="Amphidinium massartii, Strain CS-259" /LENGTH=382 /DNA_ID=CAMNT_0020000557 /DNA_START=15 /DNA_END=1163 /DNA_ORIENTATION=+